MTAQRPLDVRTLNSAVKAAVASPVTAVMASPVTAVVAPPVTAVMARLSGRS
ncbi:hypothetical protein [Streptomyces sp. NPDC041003]|uniref:hypothetical protein n=1 Tax=Streptomyces sp. NPDC041003 TaxID=3155730 RepID=UPI0033D9D42E